ncbi:MAG: hypothetical protein R2751_09265 [Bacteroidales bacterium]
MKKAIKINLSGIIFHIDDDAYDKLKAYLIPSTGISPTSRKARRSSTTSNPESPNCSRNAFRRKAR